jgi:hypothetical protein
LNLAPTPAAAALPNPSKKQHGGQCEAAVLFRDAALRSRRGCVTTQEMRDSDGSRLR